MRMNKFVQISEYCFTNPLKKQTLSTFALIFLIATTKTVNNKPNSDLFLGEAFCILAPINTFFN